MSSSYRAISNPAFISPPPRQSFEFPAFSPRKRGRIGNDGRRRITDENRATFDDRATFADDLDDQPIGPIEGTGRVSLQD